MRLLLALAVMVVALVAWLAFAPRQNAVRELPADPARSASNTSSEAHALDVAREGDAPRRALEVATETTAAANGAISSSRIHGRVVDELGNVINGARVLLREWGSFPDVLAQHETTSGHTGLFELTIPAPASERQSLTCSAEPFHVQSELWYGLATVGEVKKLTAGDVDAGVFTLPACGIVEGRVLTDGVRPVADIWVRLLADGKDSLGANTDANGRYSIRAALPGRWLLTIKDDEWLMPAKQFVEVAARTVTPAPDLLLARAPTIEGKVVDAEGTPLANIYVFSTPLRERSFNSSSSATTLQNGTFTLRLESNEPVQLSVSPQRDFMECACKREDPRCTFEPGARDVTIVLERAPRVQFQIVDAETRAPLERFGIQLEPLEGADRYRSPVGRLPPDFHANGIVDLPVPCRAAVVVAAPGYGRTRVMVESGAGLQTIALTPGSSITGRVVIGGKPAAGAHVFGLQGELRVPGKPGTKAFELQGKGASENALNTTANELGEFTLTDLAADTYSLRITADDGVMRTLEALVVPRAGVLALGDIDLARAATVRGVVRTAAGDSPKDITVALDDRRVVSIKAEDGLFVFTGLAGGPHWLTWWRGSSRLVTHRVDFDIGAGQTREIVIDATANVPCTLRVHVRKNGQPAANVWVVARSVTDRKGAAIVGATDAAGNVVGRVDGGAHVVVEATSVEKRALGVARERIDTVAGGDVSCVIDIQLGSLTLELPAAMTPPEHGRVTLQFMNGATSMALSPSGPPRGPAESLWSTNLIDFGEYPAGSHAVEVRIERYERDVNDNNPKAGRWIPLREPFAAQFEIRDGEATRVVVP